MVLFAGVVFLISGLLFACSRQATEDDGQNRKILRGLGLAFLTMGLFSVYSLVIPWVLSASDKNVVQMGAWAILVPPMVFFLAVLTRSHRALARTVVLEESQKLGGRHGWGR